MINKTIFLTALIFILTASAFSQMTLTGDVVDVLDGKTILLSAPTGKVRAELQYIEVPEPGQPLRDVVVDHLKQLTLGKRAVYRAQRIFKDRTVGRLLINNVDISQQMLRDGAAWLVPQNVSGQEQTEMQRYAASESDAKTEKRGVWDVAGLRSPWEYRAEKQRLEDEKNATKVKDDNFFATAGGVKIDGPRRGTWGDVNPNMKNVGALSNGYNALTRQGWVGTSFLGILEQEGMPKLETRVAIDYSYVYQEDPQKGRRGKYIITIISAGNKFAFLAKNDLTVIADAKKNLIGRAKRTTSNAGGVMTEKLVYEVDRSVMERIANGSEVNIKIGDLMVIPMPGLQMLIYNLLDATK